MNLDNLDISQRVASIPRVSGGEPMTMEFILIMVVYSTRERG